MTKSAKKIICSICAVAMTASMAISASAADYAAPNISADVVVSQTSVSVADVTEGSGAVKVAEGNVKLKTSAMKALAASKDGVLELEGKKATITIDASTITKVKNVDLSVKVTNSKSQTKLTFKKAVDFGCEVQIEVTTCKMSAEKLANAHVYCNDEDLGPVTINEAGNPVFTVTKGGTYIIK